MIFTLAKPYNNNNETKTAFTCRNTRAFFLVYVYVYIYTTPSISYYKSFDFFPSQTFLNLIKFI